MSGAVALLQPVNRLGASRVPSLGFCAASDRKAAPAVSDASALSASCDPRLRVSMSAPQLRTAPLLTRQRPAAATKMPANLLGRPLTVGANELSCSTTEQLKAVLGAPHVLVRIVDVFQTWDTDRSGTIDKFEFARALQTLGARLPPLQMKALFNEFDADRSGTIAYSELRKQLRAAYNIQHSGRPRHAEAPPGPPPADVRAVKKLQSLIATNFDRIERIIVRWVASGALARPTSFSIVRPPPPLPELVEEADEAVAAAQEALTMAVREATEVRGSLQRVEQAVAQSVASAKPKKGKPPAAPSALLDARDACHAAVLEAQQVVAERRQSVQTAVAAAAAVRSDNEMRERAEHLIKHDASLQQRHVETTGRTLPCRLPFALDQATTFVVEHPTEVHLSFSELRRALGLLWQTPAGEPLHEKRTVGILFAILRGTLGLQELRRQTRIDVRGVVSLGALKEGCCSREVDALQVQASQPNHGRRPVSAAAGAAREGAHNGAHRQPGAQQRTPPALRPSSAM